MQADWHLAKKVLFTNYFTLKSSQAHKIVDKLFLDRKNPHYNGTLIIAPRGFAKSTLVQLNSLLAALQGDERYILLVSYDDESAIKKVTDIRNELRYNEKITYFYGRQHKRGNWTKGKFTTAGGVYFDSRSIMSGVFRGLKDADSRPTLIILDDIEGKKNTETTEQRRSTKEKFLQEMKPCLDVSVKHGRRIGNWICVGTITHELGLINELHNKREELKLRAVKWAAALKWTKEEGSTKQLWTEKYTNRFLSTEHDFFIELYGDRGEALFMQEYFNIPARSALSIFHEHYFTQRHDYFLTKGTDNKWYLIDKKKTMLKPVNVYVGVDPAAKTGNENDFTAIVVIAVDESFDVYFIELIRSKILIDRIEDVIVDIAIKYEPDRINIENYAFQSLLEFNLIRRFKEENLDASMIKGRNKGAASKSASYLESLQPLAKRGKLILSTDESMQTFVNEAVDFVGKASKRDDVLDATWLALADAQEPYHKGYESVTVAEFEENLKKLHATRELFIYDYKQVEDGWSL